MPDSVSLPSESFSDSSDVVSRIAPAKEQTGGAEKQVAKFLENAGLAEAVLQGEDFHLRIENEPYIPSGGRAAWGPALFDALSDSERGYVYRY